MSRPAAVLPWTRLRIFTAVGWIAALVPTPVPAGQVAPTEETRAPVSHSTVVSVAVRIAAGSAEDPEGTEGAAWILGHALAYQANATLDPSTARVEVAVGRSATVFTLTALPDGWRTAQATLERVLFQGPLDEGAVLAQRAAMEARLAFEGGSPVKDFEQESAGIFAPPGHPWARPMEGTLESLAAIRTFDIDLFRRNHYRVEAATTAVVGDADAATEGPATPASDSVAPPAASGLAWLAGKRIVLSQEVTSTWIAVGFPLDASAPRTALEMFVHLVTDALDPPTPDPYRYGLEIEIVTTPGGPALVIRTAVAPEAADAWERKILAAVAELRETVPEGEFFRWSRRRFRSVRLLADELPGARARRVVDDLVRQGSPRSLDSEIWALTRDDLLVAGRAVGEARVLRLGPDLGQSGAGRT